MLVSGNIPARDIGLVVRSLNKCPTEAELKEILKKVNTDRGWSFCGDFWWLFVLLFRLDCAAPSHTLLIVLIYAISQVGAGDIVKFPEFLEIMGHKMKMVDPDNVVSSLRVFDKEGTGKIAASELKHILTQMGETLTEREVNEVMQDFPADSKGMIKYEKFVASLLEQYVV